MNRAAFFDAVRSSLFGGKDSHFRRYEALSLLAGLLQAAPTASSIGMPVERRYSSVERPMP